MNFIGDCRSNSFRVKDLPAFIEFLHQFDVTVIYGSAGDNLVGFISEDGNVPVRLVHGSNPETHLPDQDEVSILEDLAKYLAHDEVAVVMQVGAEGERYYVGQAWAVHYNGAVVTTSLDDIYDIARQAFSTDGAKTISRAEY